MSFFESPELPLGSQASTQPAETFKPLPPYQAPEQTTTYGARPRRNWGNVIRRALSLRIFINIFAVSCFVVWLTDLFLPRSVLIWPACIFFWVCWLGAVFNDDVLLDCPFCGKRLKIGKSTCHHCGHDVR